MLSYLVFKVYHERVQLFIGPKESPGDHGREDLAAVVELGLESVRIVEQSSLSFQNRPNGSVEGRLLQNKC